MSNHNAETSKLFKQRYTSQNIISEKQRQQIEKLEEEVAVLKHTVIRVHNTAQLAGDFPSKQTMVDIVNLCDTVL